MAVHVFLLPSPSLRKPFLIRVKEPRLCCTLLAMTLRPRTGSLATLSQPSPISIKLLWVLPSSRAIHGLFLFPLVRVVHWGKVSTIGAAFRCQYDRTTYSAVLQYYLLPTRTNWTKTVLKDLTAWILKFSFTQKIGASLNAFAESTLTD